MVPATTGAVFEAVALTTTGVARADTRAMAASVVRVMVFSPWPDLVGVGGDNLCSTRPSINVRRRTQRGAQWGARYLVTKRNRVCGAGPAGPRSACSMS